MHQHQFSSFLALILIRSHSFKSQPHRSHFPSAPGFSVTGFSIHMFGPQALRAMISIPCPQRLSAHIYPAIYTSEHIRHFGLWSLRDSNPRPPLCKSDALPAELSDPEFVKWVGKRGLEPPLPCGNRLLKPARLPVPPLALDCFGVTLSVTITKLSLVGERGFEPPLPCGNRPLKPARLPVPPLAQNY